MASSFNTNGVSRYIEMLISGINQYYYNNYDVIYIKLQYYNNIILPKIINHNNYVEIIVPLPEEIGQLIKHEYWNSSYNELIYHLLSDYISGDSIVHIHTMNLIDLALLIKRQKQCIIISHIHCIPWKYLYSSDIHKFNYLYKKTELEKEYPMNAICRLFSDVEIKLVTQSDFLICVTKNAKNFYERYFGPIKKSCCIYNGVYDKKKRRSIKKTGSTRILYVGALTEEKGVIALLQVVSRIIDENKYDIVLSLVGNADNKILELLSTKYNNTRIRYFGHMNNEQLQNMYSTCDIGVIPSLFEQCSYVALEMIMNKIPVVYAKNESLEEIFLSECGLPFQEEYSVQNGLYLNLQDFYDKLIVLIENVELREYLSRKAGKRYKEHFTTEKMIRQTINIYQRCLK